MDYNKQKMHSYLQEFSEKRNQVLGFRTEKDKAIILGVFIILAFIGIIHG
jgi:hypothetical protein